MRNKNPYYSDKIFRMICDIQESPTIPIKEFVVKHRIGRTIQTILKKNGYSDGKFWIGGIATMQKAQDIATAFRRYNKESIKARNKKQQPKEPAANLFSISEAEAIEVLKNSATYIYKVSRTPKKSAEEILL